MPKPTSYKNRVVYFLFFAMVFLIGFPILMFYSAGYTLDETFGLSIRGGIYVSTPEPNTSIFLGNELKSVSGFFKKEVLMSGLKPGQYLILAANDDFWPWAKLVNVEAGEVEPLAPLLVPKVLKIEEIKKADAGYAEISALFATTTFPTVAHKKVKVWLDGDNVYGQWLGSVEAKPKYFPASPLLVFHSYVPVRAFDFYPLRDDAIILALDNGLYAAELDNRQYQNFYPIYRGLAPDFRVSKNQIFIKDEGKIMAVNF